MAQGVAWARARLGVPCTVSFPITRPETKLDAIERLGGADRKGALRRSGGRCWSSTAIPGVEGHFVHPVSDPAVIAGNGTIGLEIARGPARRGHGARAVRRRRAQLAASRRRFARSRPTHASTACEVETAAPLAASLGRGRSAGRRLHARASSTGSAAGALLGEMWPLVRSLLAGSIVVVGRRDRGGGAAPRRARTA